MSDQLGLDFNKELDMNEKDYIIERRFTSKLEARASEKGERTINGEAALINSSTIIFDGYEEYEEVIRSGAFDTSVTGDIRVLKNHSEDLLLGRSKNGNGTARVFVNQEGNLAFETPVRDSRSHSVDTYDEVLSGDLDGCSFAFRVSKEKWTFPNSDNGRTLPLREILSFEVINDVGPVTYPAYKSTSVVARSVKEMRKSEKPDLSAMRKRQFELIELKSK